MTEIQLSQKPKGVTIIEGFPGFGLVGTIATGFLIDHLKCEKIGTHWFEELPATLAVHDNKIVDPVGIYYSKQYNLVILHSIASANGIEWIAADHVMELCKVLDAKELISIEGVGSQKAEKQRAFYYSSVDKNAKALEKAGMEKLKEGIVIGVTASLLLKVKIPHVAIFAETHTNLPDSKAAAKVIEVLDKYLGFEVDYKPLLKQAEEFETKIKSLMEKQASAHEIKDKKQLSYIS